jgi:hypothetical protein
MRFGAYDAQSTNQEQCTMPIRTVEVTAPVKDGDIGPIKGKTYPDAEIVISVRELTNGERGLLNPEKYNASQRQDHIEAALERKNQDDYKAYNKTTAQLAEMSKEQGYYNSPAHIAWTLAAKERSGGAIDAATWRKMDPFGGTAGNGPEILPTGKYPGGLSTISMAHDTDWSLGRYFNAGPMKALHTSTESPLQMGMYGLQNHSTVRPRVDDLYTTGGHADWEVNYYKGKGVRMGSAEVGDASLVAVVKDAPGVNKTSDGNVLLASARTNPLEDGTHPYSKHFTQALEGANGNRDAAAAAVDAISKAPGYKPDQDISVTQGKNGLIVSQGQGDAALNLQVPQAKPGDFEKIATQMAQPQQIAMQTDQPEQRIKGLTV